MVLYKFILTDCGIYSKDASIFLKSRHIGEERVQPELRFVHSVRVQMERELVQAFRVQISNKEIHFLVVTHLVGLHEPEIRCKIML